MAIFKCVGALLYVGFHCLSLDVSAYMSIFKCVGYFYFRVPEGICFAGPPPHVVTHCTFAFVSACGQTHTQNNEINEGKQHRNKTQMETFRV
jgi:hypothetical protein